MKEIWKDIKEYEGLYQVSNMGKVKSLRRIHGIINKILSNHLTRGYYSVKLSVNRKEKDFNVHRLVANAFIPNPLAKPCVNHRDANKCNNEFTNLEWCTHQENMDHASFMNLLVKGERNHKHKLSMIDVNFIREKRKEGFRVFEIAKSFRNVDYSTIFRIANNESWKQFV
jgi:hypothetical protein